MSKKQGFDMLENADEKTMGRLSEIKVLSAEEKARMFRASKEKYNQMLGKAEVSVGDNEDRGTEEMKIVEVNRKPEWMAFLSAAACVAVICGILGFSLLHGNTELPDDINAGVPVTSVAVTSKTEPAGTDDTSPETTALTAEPVIVNVTETAVSASAENLKAESKAVSEREAQITEAPAAVTENKETTAEEKHEVTAETAVITEEPETLALGESLYKTEIEHLWQSIENDDKTLEYTLFDVDHDGVRELFVKYGDYAYNCRFAGFTLKKDGRELCILDHFDMIPADGLFARDTSTDEFVIATTRNGDRFLYWYELDDVSMVIAQEKYSEAGADKGRDGVSESIVYLDTAGLYCTDGVTYSYSEKGDNYTEKEGTDYEMFWNN